MGETPQKPPKCPICTKPAADRYRPFCSKRCADVDLARWLGGNYRVPTEETGGLEEGEAGLGALESWEKQD